MKNTFTFAPNYIFIHFFCLLFTAPGWEGRDGIVKCVVGLRPYFRTVHHRSSTRNLLCLREVGNRQSRRVRQNPRHRTNHHHHSRRAFHAWFLANLYPPHSDGRRKCVWSSEPIKSGGGKTIRFKNRSVCC